MSDLPPLRGFGLFALLFQGFRSLGSLHPWLTTPAAPRLKTGATMSTDTPAVSEPTAGGRQRNGPGNTPGPLT